MGKKHTLTCASFSLLFLTLSAVLLKDRHTLLCFLAFTDLAVTFALMPRRTVISFSLSMLAATFLLMYLRGSSISWLVLSLALTAASAVMRLLKKLPDYRPTTDMWVGTLILLETAATLIYLV